MKAKLIACSQPIKGAIIGLDDVQDLIVYCARVSNPDNQLNTETGEKLLSYLAKNAHWSPFELASATLEIETTRDIARQFLRHRSFSFNEFSQRYQNVGAMGEAFVIREARLQHSTNRQASIETSDEDLQKMWVAKQQQVIHEAKLAYKWALENGIAKEQARVVLPEGNTVSRLYVQGTIRSWMHYIQLRTEEGTQKEHRELAKEIASAITQIFPLVKNFIATTTSEASQ